MRRTRARCNPSASAPAMLADAPRILDVERVRAWWLLAALAARWQWFRSGGGGGRVQLNWRRRRAERLGRCGHGPNPEGARVGQHATGTTGHPKGPSAPMAAERLCLLRCCASFACEHCVHGRARHAGGGEKGRRATKRAAGARTGRFTLLLGPTHARTQAALRAQTWALPDLGIG